MGNERAWWDNLQITPLPVRWTYGRLARSWPTHRSGFERGCCRTPGFRTLIIMNARASAHPVALLTTCGWHWHPPHCYCRRKILRTMRSTQLTTFANLSVVAIAPAQLLVGPAPPIFAPPCSQAGPLWRNAANCGTRGAAIGAHLADIPSWSPALCSVSDGRGGS